jgi:hypothetical protein
MPHRRALLLAALAACFVRPARAAPSPLDSCFRHPASARAIGRAYIAAAPEEVDPGRLATLLGMRPGSDEPVDALRWRIGARVRADFAAGRTVELEGWLLAESEARLCALLALA